MTNLNELVSRIEFTVEKRAEENKQFIDRGTFIRIELASEIYGMLMFADEATIERMMKRFPKGGTNENE